MPAAFAEGQHLEWQRHPPQQQPQRPRVWGGVRRRVELAAGVFALIIQLMVWGRTAPALSLRGHLHQVRAFSWPLTGVAELCASPTTAGRPPPTTAGRPPDPMASWLLLQAALVAIQSCAVGITLLLPFEAWKRYRCVALSQPAAGAVQHAGCTYSSCCWAGALLACWRLPAPPFTRADKLVAPMHLCRVILITALRTSAVLVPSHRSSTVGTHSASVGGSQGPALVITGAR